MKVNDKTLKFIIFILSFLAIVMAFVFLFVIPSIKSYKTQKTAYQYQTKKEKELSAKKAELEQALKDTEKKYENALNAFKEDFNETAFLQVAGKYFQNVKLVPQGHKTTESGLQIYQFHADFSAQTPVKFYQFIDELNRMKNVVKINFPIELLAQDKKIWLRFKMSVYRL